VTFVIGYHVDGGAVLAAGRGRLVDGVARATGDRNVRAVGDAALAVRGDARAVDAVFRRVAAAEADGDATAPTTADLVADALRPRRLDATAAVADPAGGSPDGDGVTLRRVDADGSIAPVGRIAVGTPPTVDEAIRTAPDDVTVEAAVRTVRTTLARAAVDGPVDVVAVRPGAVEHRPGAERSVDAADTDRTN
jgi:hypothetical protein